MHARAEDTEARLERIYASPNVHPVLDLRNLIKYCEDLDSCKKIVDTLKKEIPLASNYAIAFFKERGCTKWELDRVNRMPFTYSFFSCLGFNRKDNLQFDPFCRTHFEFGIHIETYGLTYECRLYVSEEQNLLINALKKHREKHIADLLASNEGEQKQLMRPRQ